MGYIFEVVLISKIHDVLLMDWLQSKREGRFWSGERRITMPLLEMARLGGGRGVYMGVTDSVWGI